MYNIFENVCRSLTKIYRFDKHNNAEISDCFEEISAISNLLHNFSRFKTVNDFNNSLKLTNFKNESFSVLFLKISMETKQTLTIFKVHMKRLEHKFSGIGVAES